MILQNSIIYGIAILFSLVIFLLFVMPLEVTEMLYHKTLLELLILMIILIFPLTIAWLFITKGIISFFLSLPFYLLGLLSLYRGFYYSNQFSIIDYMLTQLERTQLQVQNSFIEFESIILYLLINCIGIIVALVIGKRLSDGKN